MLIVGSVKGMTHANYPRESWIAYDEFLSKFSNYSNNVFIFTKCCKDTKNSFLAKTINNTAME